MGCSFLRPPVDTDKLEEKRDLQKDLELLIDIELAFGGLKTTVHKIAEHAIRRAIEAETKLAESQQERIKAASAYAEEKLKNAELQKKLDETIDDLLIARKDHNSAHDESLRFNQRLIEAEGINEQFEAQCAVMREAINYVISILNRTDEYKESDLLHWVMNDANKFLSQTAGQELLDSLNTYKQKFTELHALSSKLVKEYELSESQNAIYTKYLNEYVKMFEETPLFKDGTHRVILGKEHIENLKKTLNDYSIGQELLDKVKRYEDVLRKVTNHSEWAVRGANRYGLVMGKTVEKDFKEAREALEAKANE